MDSRERVSAVLNNEPADCIPIFPKIAFSNVIAYPGMTVRDYMTSSQSMARAAISAQRLFCWDAVALHTDIGSEGRALGSVYELPQDAPSHIVRYLLNDIAEYEKATVANPYETEPMKTVIGAVKLVKEAIGSKVYIQAWTNGPLNVASQLLRLDNLFLEMMDRPDMLHLLLERCLETATVYAKALIVAGADAIAFGHAMASQSVISRRQYQEFAMPYEKRLISAIHSKGAKAITHICGNIEPIADIISETGPDIIDFDHMCDLDILKQKAPRAIFRGNIDPALLATGTPEQVYESIRELLKKDGRSGRLILGTGCEVSLNTPAENLHAFVKGGHDHGTF